MKMINYFLAFTSLCALSSYLEAANEKSKETNAVNQTKGNSSATQEKYNREKYKIIERDEIDNSNTLAIPFDDSEVEDEEEINRDEDKEVFSLPKSR